MSIIGDSISAGTGAVGNASGIFDLLDAGQEQPENSWATGTAGGLNSVYQRLAAIQPAVEGRNDRRAVNGADMSNAPGQANAIPTGTEYVLIQMGGNDLCKSNESQMSSVTDYRDRFNSTLNNIWNRSPNALVYVASIPDIYNLWYLRGAPNPPNPNTSPKATGLVGARTFWSGTVIGIQLGEFPCQSLLRDATSLGGAESRRQRVRQRNIELNQVLAEECAKRKYCRFDDYELFNFSSNRVWSGPGQAPSSAPLKPADQFEFTDGDISGLDHFHPSISGQRKLADIAWRTSFDFNDRTAPAISASVATSIGSDGKRRVEMSASDAAGVRAIEYRLHLPTGTSAWTSLLDTDAAVTSVPVYADQLAWVETRALDRNGNMSAGSLATVYPLPGGPTGPTFRQVVINDLEGVRVNWVEPTDERGTRGEIAPTVAYQVVASPGGQTCETLTSSLDPLGCMVTGLSPGVSYSFSVRAVTQGGPGPAVAAEHEKLRGPTSAVYAGPSGPVDELAVAPAGSDLVVRWAAPQSLNGGTLKGYEVRAARSDAGGAPSVVSGCTTTEKTFPGQAPEDVYFTATECTLPNVAQLEAWEVEVVAFTELPISTKPVVTSEVASASGWMPEPPALDDQPETTLSSTERSVTVVWPALAPTQLAGGATVTVTAEPGGMTCTVPATETSCVITGLNPLTNYTFTVVVDNGAGTARAESSGRIVVPAESAAPFTDISGGAYFAEPARWLRANGVTQGIGGSDRFDPAGRVTRAQMAAFLWRFAGKPSAPASCGFRDEWAIPAYARPAACWLKATRITENNPYDPNGGVTRAQMAAFLWRAAGRPSAPESCDFRDERQIPTWARAGACWLRDNGITVNNPYKAGDPVTRGQMAAFLFRTHGVLTPEPDPEA